MFDSVRKASLGNSVEKNMVKAKGYLQREAKEGNSFSILYVFRATAKGSGFSC